MSGPPRLEPGCISVRGLARGFGRVQALHPLDLDVGPGGVVGLLGPNGSGKSTLLRLLLGLVRPDAGEVALDGARLRGDGVELRRRSTYQPGEVGVYGEMRGGEHLAWFCRGRPRAALRRALEVADELGLPLERRVRAYSQGMKRQLVFAASMGPDVRVRILDEPTDGLDPTMRRRVLALLEEDARRGTTIFLSSHHLAEVQEVCDRMVFLSQGRLLADEAAEELRGRSRTLVRLTWEDPGAARAATERLGALEGVSVELDDRRVVVRVGELDPGEVVGRASALEGVRPPSAAEYGSLSLAELYRDLYGIEAL